MAVISIEIQRKYVYSWWDNFINHLIPTEQTHISSKRDTFQRIKMVNEALEEYHASIKLVDDSTRCIQITFDDESNYHWFIMKWN